VKVLASVLGGGMGGRLFAELRDRRGLAYAASTFYEPTREPGALILYLGTAPENAAAAEAALRAEIEHVKTTLVSEEDLRRAKGYLLGAYALDRRTNARQAWYLAFYELVGVGLDYPERFRKAVEAVTAEDVRRVARAYLGTLTTVVLRPR
jgi:predicted Zn-dependent peptidase